MSIHTTVPDITDDLLTARPVMVTDINVSTVDTVNKISSAYLKCDEKEVYSAQTQRPLALFSGKPAFAQPLHVGRPNLGDKEAFLSRISQMWDRRWLTNNGPFVCEFEQRVADMLDVPHCIAVCNATVGLELTIRALRMTGEVIIPSFTFIATAHALQWQSIQPVFADVDPQTHNIDPDSVESLINERTTGIIGVHLWGRPCAVEQLESLAKRHHLSLMFDASHAFGCSLQARSVGSLGDAEVFSFHATKFLNAFEGGMITTRSAELAQRLRLMRNFGFEGIDHVTHIGTNGKMCEASAAMALTSLESIDTIIAANLKNYEHYAEELGSLRGITLMPYDTQQSPNYQYVILDIDQNHPGGLTRNELVSVLTAENILARRYFTPGCHRSEPYRTLYPLRNGSLPHTDQLCERLISLPTGTAVGRPEIEIICSLLKTAIDEAPAIRKYLKSMNS